MKNWRRNLHFPRNILPNDIVVYENSSIENQTYTYWLLYTWTLFAARIISTFEVGKFRNHFWGADPSYLNQNQNMLYGFGTEKKKKIMVVHNVFQPTTTGGEAESH